MDKPILFYRQSCPHSTALLQLLQEHPDVSARFELVDLDDTHLQRLKTRVYMVPAVQLANNTEELAIGKDAYDYVRKIMVADRYHNTTDTLQRLIYVCTIVSLSGMLLKQTS